MVQNWFEDVKGVRPSMPLHLTVIHDRLAICRLPAGVDVPAWADDGGFSSVTRTPEETSVVCREANVPEALAAERGWRAVRVRGPLDFGMTGVVAALVQPLAEARIPVFVLSTYDTDYLLVPSRHLDAALDALAAAGHTVQ